MNSSKWHYQLSCQIFVLWNQHFIDKCSKQFMPWWIFSSLFFAFSVPGFCPLKPMSHLFHNIHKIMVLMTASQLCFLWYCCSFAFLKEIKSCQVAMLGWMPTCAWHEYSLLWKNCHDFILKIFHLLLHKEELWEKHWL